MPCKAPALCHRNQGRQTDMRVACAAPDTCYTLTIDTACLWQLLLASTKSAPVSCIAFLATLDPRSMPPMASHYLGT